MSSNEGRRPSKRKDGAQVEALAETLGSGNGTEVLTRKRRSQTGEAKRGLELDPILEELGSRGRYQITQVTLCLVPSFLFAMPLMDIKFMGYQPDYQCSELDNATQLETYLPDNVTSFVLHDVRYHQCSIDVTVNTSNASSTHSLPCVHGVNFSMPSHTSFLTEWSLVCDKAGATELTQTAMFGGLALGSLVFSILADRYGRKRTYVPCTLCSLLLLAATSAVPSYIPLLVCRFAVGFFTVGMIHPAFTMVVEGLPQEWRGLASSIDSLLFSLGCIFMAAMAYVMQDLSWRYLNLAFASGFVYSLVMPWFLDESLRWLLAAGKVKEAEKILRKACQQNGKDFGTVRALLLQQTSAGHDQCLLSATKPNKHQADTAVATDEAKNGNVTKDGTLVEGAANGQMGEEMCEEGRAASAPIPRGPEQHHAGASPGSQEGISHSAQPETVPAHHSIVDLFRHRVVLVPFLVTLFVWITNNLYYYAVMLGSINMSENRFLNFGLLNLQNFPSTLVALFLLFRINRRPLAFTCGMLSGSFLLISVALLAFGGEEGVFLTLATVAQYTGMFCLNGSYILLFIYSMEVYPTAMRAVGSGFAATILTLSNMGIPFLLLWTKHTPWSLGVVVGCLCCLASFSVWLLPETRHRKLPDTIEEIQAWRRRKSILG